MAETTSTLEAQSAEWGAARGTQASGARSVLRFARRNPAGAVSVVVLLVLAVIAIAAPLVAPYDPTDTAPLQRLHPLSGAHWMGTDETGRDVFSRVVYGSRISLFAGVVGTAISVLIGALLGSVAGYVGGAVDLVISRLVDAFMAMPALILMLVVVVLIGRGALTIAISIGVVFTAPVTRVVRSAALGVRHELWVTAAVAIGCPPQRILWRYVVPNVIPILIVIGSVSIGSAILAEAGVSFLGYGVRPPTPSWGQMLSSGSRINQQHAPWLAIFPGLAIAITVLAANLAGDAVRDMVDPRLRGR